MDLVTNAEVLASWPGFGSLNADEQAALISDASRAIEDYCGRSFGTGTVTETCSGNNQGRLWLRKKPVLAVQSVTVNGEALDNTDGDGWQFDGETGALVRGSGLRDPRYGPAFPNGIGNIEVVYEYGYAEVPDPVKRACKLTIRQIADLSKGGTTYSSESIGDYSYQRGDAGQDSIPPAATRLLGRYIDGGII